MAEFEGKLYENRRWEEKLESEGAFCGGAIVLFGDSQVAMWRSSRHFCSLPVRNRGVSGDCADAARGRFRQEAACGELRAAVILIGTNDVARGRKPAEIAADIEAMAQTAKERGAACFICSVLPVSGWFSESRPKELLLELNNALRIAAKQQGIRYIDFWPALADGESCFKQEMTCDGLHPNSAGYRGMTAILLRELEAAALIEH